jgi:YVTN family beta-propeller protein
MLAVANSGADSVSLVNLETNQEVAQIPVGRLPYGVAITPDGSTLYVNNWGENTVSVVDLLALKEVNKISVGGLPYTIVMNPNGEVVYVSNFASNSISVLSTATNETIATVPITGRSPWGIALSPDGHTLASANFHSGDVSLVAVNPHYLESARIDLRFESENVPTGTFAAKNIRYVSTGALIVVSNLASNEIRVIDTAKGKVVRTIKVGQAPYGLAELTPHASTGK